MNKFCAYCDIKILEDDRSCQGCGAPVKKAKEKKSLDVRGGKGQFITAVADAFIEPRDLFDISKSARDGSKWYDDVADIAILGGDVQMKNGERAFFDVKAVHKDGSISSIHPKHLYSVPLHNDIVHLNDDTNEIVARRKGKTSLMVRLRERNEVYSEVEITIK